MILLLKVVSVPENHDIKELAFNL